jgi:DNA-binding transcriptional ArsR family regulator
MKEHIVRGFRFNTYQEPERSVFDRLLEIFTDLLTHTSGDFDEAIDWLRMLDEEYQLTTPEYTIDDFIEDLKKKGYIREEINPDGNGNGVTLSAKMEQNIVSRHLNKYSEILKRAETEIIKRIKAEQVKTQPENSEIIISEML